MQKLGFLFTSAHLARFYRNLTLLALLAAAIGVQANPAVEISGQNPIRIEAEDFCESFGVLTETTEDSGGGLNVGWLAPDDYMIYDLNLPQAPPLQASGGINSIPFSHRNTRPFHRIPALTRTRTGRLFAGIESRVELTDTIFAPRRSGKIPTLATTLVRAQITKRALAALSISVVVWMKLKSINGPYLFQRLFN